MSFFGSNPAAPSTSSTSLFGATAQQQQQQQAGQQQPGQLGSAPVINFGLGGSTQTSTSVGGAAAPFSFGAPIAPIVSSTPFSFGGGQVAPGTTISTSAGMPFSFGGGLAPAVQTQAQSQSQASAQPTFVPGGNFGGLGGISSSGVGTDSSTGFGGFPNTLGKSAANSRGLMELPIPTEVLQIVEDLKNHMKNQKVKMTEVGRSTDRNVERVSEEIEDLKLTISRLSNQVQRQGMVCLSLLDEIQKDLKNLDMAMVTKDTPLALQNELNGTKMYFHGLLSDFGDKMKSYHREIQRSESSLASIVENPGFAPRELMNALRVSKDNIMAMAAQVQELHEKVVNEMATNKNLKRLDAGNVGNVALGNVNSGSGRGGWAGPGYGQGNSNARNIEPVIPHSLNNNYNRTYDRVNNVLFMSPARREDGFRSGAGIGATASTPLFTRQGYHQSPPPLFQTASSTILGNSTLGHSMNLKRPKDK